MASAAAIATSLYCLYGAVAMQSKLENWEINLETFLVKRTCEVRLAKHRVECRSECTWCSRTGEQEGRGIYRDPL